MPERIDRLIACGIAASDPRCAESTARENSVFCAERLMLIWKALSIPGISADKVRVVAERGITNGIICKVCCEAVCRPGSDHCGAVTCIPF